MCYLNFFGYFEPHRNFVSGTKYYSILIKLSSS